MRSGLFKRYFITGLLIWVPLAITAWVLNLIVGTMDQSLRLLPESIHPQNLLGFYLPGIGALITLLVILLTGVAAAKITASTRPIQTRQRCSGGRSASSTSRGSAGRRRMATVRRGGSWRGR